MGLLSELGSMFEGGEAQRMASGQGNYQDPASPDTQRLQTMISRMDPQQLQQIFSQAAQRMDSQQYAEHVTPGAGGTNPLGSLGSGGLGSIATTLLQHLSASGIAGNLLSKIPGLNTTDPSRMDAGQVAALARYTQQNHPDVFGRAAAQIGQNQPDLLHSFLGKAGMAIGAAALASHFLGRQQ